MIGFCGGNSGECLRDILKYILRVFTPNAQANEVVRHGIASPGARRSAVV
jgi:hypothetical protein